MTTPIYVPPGLGGIAPLPTSGGGAQPGGLQLTPAQARQAANNNYVTGATPTNPYTSYIQVSGKRGTPEFNQGSTLLGTLTLPNGVMPDSLFAWNVTSESHYQQSGNQRGPDGLNTKVTRQTQTLTEMTMAGALSWLRNLAVNAPDQYDTIVMQLVAAGYLDYSDARFGSYTTTVGNKFLQSAADVWSINSDEGAGQLTTWGDHIQAMIQARMRAGQIDANGLPLSGSGGGGGAERQAPTRVDRFTDPETVKAAGNGAAKDILGRDLNESEMSQFSAIFHAAEQTWNDQQFAAQMQEFNGGGSAAIVDRPNSGASALNYVKTDPGLSGERTEQSLGSYIGVLRQMTGLGSGGISNAIA